MRILQFGGDVIVLEPEELRQDVISESKRICRNYVEINFNIGHLLGEVVKYYGTCEYFSSKEL